MLDYRRLSKLAGEFTRLWKRLQAFYLDAAVGFEFVRSEVEADQARARSYVRESELDSEGFQDKRTYSRIFSEEFAVSAIHQVIRAR
jgi:hypothetical protein